MKGLTLHTRGMERVKIMDGVAAGVERFVKVKVGITVRIRVAVQLNCLRVADMVELG